MEDKPRRRVTRTQLPTSPISSGTGTGVSDKFQGFGLEHVPLVGGGDVGVAMDELSFDHEHVSGMMFDNMM